MKIYQMYKKIYYSFYVKIKEEKFKNLKYILKKADNNILIVIFSGFPGTSRAKYNYINTLRDCVCNQLFILDNFGYKQRGSYYLGENGEWFLVEEINNLIQNIIQKLNIKHIITAGSSKGGTSALFYGIKCQADVSIIGAPQYYIGDYLNTDNHKEILNGIIGNRMEKRQAIRILNEYVGDAVKKSRAPHPIIYIHYSYLEHTYDEHIKFMINDLKENKFDVIEDNKYSYEKHSDVASFFPRFLQNTVSSYIEKWK